MGNLKIEKLEPQRSRAATKNPPRRHGVTEKHGEKYNLPAMREKIGFTRALENSKAYQKEHGEKAEVTEKYVERTDNATKLDLIFFSRKEEFCG